MKRLRAGETIALLGGLGLGVLLAFDWFFLSTPDARIGAHESGIRSLGWLATIPVLLAVVCAIALAFFTVANRAPAMPVMLGVLTTCFGVLAALVIGIRLIAQPGLGVEAGNADVEVELPAYLGLLCAVTIAVGGWLTMADERTEARESIDQTEDVLRVRGAPRPAPPRTIDPA